MAYVIESNKPNVGNIRWSGLHIQYLGKTYTITNGYTNYKYVYWTPSSPTTLVVSNEFPTLGEDDCLLFLNKNGTAVTVPKSTVLDGDLIAPGSILADAIAANSITSEKILAGSITATQLSTGCVNSDKIAANAVGAQAIAANAVTADKIVSGAVTTDKLAAKSVTANKIASNAVTADKIAANAITADKIQAGAITVDKVSSNFGASLDLNSNVAITSKVSKGDVIAEINLSEENAKIAAGKIALEGFVSVNEKFSIDEAGYMIATGGTIAGFKIDSTSLSCDIAEDYSWLTSADETKVQQAILGNVTLTDAEIEKYNISGSYYISATDLLAIHRILTGADPNYSDSKMSINLNSARNAILIEGLTGYKAGWKTRIGAGGFQGKFVDCERLTCNDISLAGGYLDDYVVDQGTDGMWAYRKWNSGIAECWGITSFSASSYSVLNSVYYFNAALDALPSFFLDSLKDIQTTAYSNGGGLYWVSPYNFVSKVINLRIISADNSNRTVYVFASIKGTWK